MTNLSLDERERIAYANGDTFLSSLVQTVSGEIEDAKEEAAEYEKDAEAYRDLADMLGALVVSITKNADMLRYKHNREALVAKVDQITNDWGRFVNPINFVAGNRIDSIKALTECIGEIEETVHYMHSNT